MWFMDVGMLQLYIFTPIRVWWRKINFKNIFYAFNIHQEKGSLASPGSANHRLNTIRVHKKTITH